MKNSIKFLCILALCFTCVIAFAIACKSNTETPHELKVQNVYSYNGYIYYQFYGFSGIYLAPDCPINTKSDNDYAGIRAYYDGFANQVIELIKAKDMQIESAENVIEAQKEYMKINGLIEK